MSRPATFRLAPQAAGDLRNILRYTLRHFGRAQHDIYAALIRRAADLIAEQPDRIGSVYHGSLQPGLRGFPVWLAARRRTAASHVLFYRHTPRGVRILRILHEAMDPERHLAPASVGEE